jgi:hypothetical protein
MLKYIAEQGRTLAFYLDCTDLDKNPLTPNTFEAVVTEEATNTIVQTVSQYDIPIVGTIRVLIDTQNLNVGRHFINFKATNGTYKQEDVVLLDIQNHEGR